MGQSCEVYRLGLIPYEQGWQMQNALAMEIAAGARPPTLLLLEHPHSFTFGRRGKIDHLLWDEVELARRNIVVHWVDRGGDVTYHGPGQLVGYPLLPLEADNFTASSLPVEQPALPMRDYVGYVRRLEKMLIAALASLGVVARQIEGLTGVWVNGNRQTMPRGWQTTDAHLPHAVSHPQYAKLAAIGVKVDARGVSRHGFALNVCPDMSYWQGIVGCGLKDYPAISLAELLNTPPTMAQVMDAIVTAFGVIFGYEMMHRQRIGDSLP